MDWDQTFLEDKKPSIAYLELFALTIAVKLWAPLITNGRVCLFVDNISVVSMINSMTSRCKNCMVLVRMIVLDSLMNNVRIFAKHISTQKNYFADALSRRQWTRFGNLARKHNKWFADYPHEIPADKVPMEKLWLNVKP